MAIKEISYILNTGELFNAEVVTSKINGKLTGFVIAANGADVRIELERWPDICLLNELQLNAIGGRYFSLVTQGNTGKSDKPDAATLWALHPVRWYLNDKLRISIDGGKNKTVTVYVRWENA